jgi:adenine-specific DNA-methyltransferase
LGSKQKTYTTPKLLGQIYTPNFIVEKILEDIRFSSAENLKKTIIDPSCGDGRFLVKVAERIITWSKPSELAQNLTYIYGYDIDEKAVTDCKKNLDELVAPFNIKVEWNIFVKNALEMYATEDEKFDFIVGNPPYIRVQHLEETQRKFIQQHFSFCQKGSTDIFIAFFQLAYHLLNNDGKCAFITPNSYFFTSTAAEFRHFFAQHQLLLQVTNYGEIQLFENASTYAAITIFSKQKNNLFLYQKAKSVDAFEEKKLSNISLQDANIWQLSTTEKVINHFEKVPLKDICKIHVGITTLCDKAYIFSIENTDNQDIITVKTKLKGDVLIEKNILKPIVKGSLLKNSEQAISEYILFPYEKINDKMCIIAEAVLQEKYPLAYAYLKSVKAELDARDNGKINKVAWYAFGRSQGLETSFGKKIIFSPMNLRPNFIDYPVEDCTFYSGYCIKYEGNTQKLLTQLNSQAMQDFVAISSRDFRGGWKAYNKKTIEEFLIDKDLL